MSDSHKLELSEQKAQIRELRKTLDHIRRSL